MKSPVKFSGNLHHLGRIVQLGFISVRPDIIGVGRRKQPYPKILSIEVKNCSGEYPFTGERGYLLLPG
jgi:hypothetical protein